MNKSQIIKVLSHIDDTQMPLPIDDLRICLSLLQRNRSLMMSFPELQEAASNIKAVITSELKNSETQRSFDELYHH